MLDKETLDSVLAHSALGLDYLRAYDAGEDLPCDWNDALQEIRDIADERIRKVVDAEMLSRELRSDLNPFRDSAVLLTRQDIESLHEKVGYGELRSPHLLESAVGRQENCLAFGDPSAYDLAVLVADGIVHDHPFTDGNKRTGLLALMASLEANGKVCPPAIPCATVIIGLATREIPTAIVSRWLESWNSPTECTPL